MDRREILQIVEDARQTGSRANLNEADLRSANLNGATLNGANLIWADLRWANLRSVNLSWADLSGANLRWANLKNANLRWANLNDANLSGALNLLNQEEWLKENFQEVEGGLLVYKAFGETCFNQTWNVVEGEPIKEVVNPNPTTECGSGVNFATLAWIRREFKHKKVTIREMVLPPFVQVVVPYNTDGKARAAKLIVGKVVE